MHRDFHFQHRRDAMIWQLHAGKTQPADLAASAL
jgi:hypothetical protein